MKVRQICPFQLKPEAIISTRTNSKAHARTLNQSNIVADNASLCADVPSNSSHRPLQGQVALVTGASSGIGRAIALELARSGLKVCLVGRSRQKLREVREQAEKTADKVLDISADLGQTRAIGRLEKLVRRELGELNILVHCAGVISLGGIETAQVEDFKRQLAIDLIGPYVLTKTFLNSLKRTRGNVVFINSSIVYNPRAGTIQFGATQHALKGFADGLRAEVNDFGIRVLSVFPGRTATPRQQRLYRLEGRAYTPEQLLQPEDIARTIVSALSLPPSAEVTDIHLRPAMKS